MAKGIIFCDAKEGRPRLDRYELIAELAAGGMATVFLGRMGGAGGFQRLVAIKRLHPHLAHEQEFVEMFLDEARLAAGIHHPNVVPILEVGNTGTGYYLVMEYIEGDTLARLRSEASRSDAGAMPLGVVLRIVLDTLLGLHAAHELRDENNQPVNVVHRDVSPQNIMIGIDGTSRITDFGVARATTRLSSTRSGEIKGKIAYMAPEQVLGDNIDRRADVFAMGVVLWEALANRHLFRGASDAITMNRVLHEPIPDLFEANPTLPRALTHEVMRALDRDRKKRPATCAELAECVERAVRGSIPVATGREVAVAVEQLIGAGLAERREAVRQWLAATETDANASLGSVRANRQALFGPGGGPASPSSQPPTLSGAQTSSVTVAGPVTPPRRKLGALGLLVLAPLLGLLGGGAFLLLHPIAPAPAAVSPVPLPVTVKSTGGEASNGAASAAAPASPASAPLPAASASASAEAEPLVARPPLLPGAAPIARPARAPLPPPSAVPKAKPPVAGDPDDMAQNPYHR